MSWVTQAQYLAKTSLRGNHMLKLSLSIMTSRSNKIKVQMRLPNDYRLTEKEVSFVMCRRVVRSKPKKHPIILDHHLVIPVALHAPQAFRCYRVCITKSLYSCLTFIPVWFVNPSRVITLECALNGGQLRSIYCLGVLH